ncbi:MAG TPA: helix-turn-helix domain-containing protein [Bryobacteraceae bacterium]
MGRPGQARFASSASLDPETGLWSAAWFDELCLTPVRALKPNEIRALRLREGASQAVFARYLNVTTRLVSQWERGEKRPQGPSLKLLSLVSKNGLEAVA